MDIDTPVFSNFGVTPTESQTKDLRPKTYVVANASTSSTSWTSLILISPTNHESPTYRWVCFYPK